MPVCDNPQHELFAQGIALKGLNRVAAYRDAGFPGIHPSAAHYVFHKPDVQRRIHELQTEHATAVMATAQRTMAEIGRIAFGDIRDLFDESGNLLPVDQLDSDAAARVASIDVEVRWEGKGEDAVPVTVKKVRTYDKMAALGLLAKHFKLVGDEGDGVNALASALADRLRQARKNRHRGEPAEADVVDVEPRQPAAPEPLQLAEDPLW